MYSDRIETRDLILRKATMDDVDAMYYNMWSEEETAKYMLWTPTKSYEEALIRMEKTIAFQKNNMAYLVHEKASNQAIGFAGMLEIENKVYEDCGIGIGTKFVRRGYGKQILTALVNYCFDELNADKIICSCRKPNIASRNMQLACGFKYTHSEDKIDKRDGQAYTIDFFEINKNTEI